MADILDTNVTVNVSVGSAPVTGTNFSVGLYLPDPGSLGAGFTERIRFYTLASEVSADLASGDITQATADALDDAFAQSPRASTFAVGRIAGGVAQVSTVVIGGTGPSVTDNFATDVTDVDGTYSLMDWTAAGGETLQDVVDGLVASFATLHPDGSRYAVEDIGSLTIQITSLVPGVAVVIASTETSATTTMTDATPTAASGAAAGEKKVEFGGSVSGGETWTLNVDGYSATYVTSGGDTADDVSDELRADLEALMPAPYNVWTDSSARIRIGAGSSNIDMDIVTETDSAAGTMTVSTVYATTAPDADLDAILAEDSGWYTMASERKSRGLALDLAAWAETNRRVFLAQSLDPLLLSGDDESLGAELKALDREYSSVNYHADDDEEFVYAWSAMKLEPDPDLRTTTWAYATLSGITPDSDVTSTQLTALEADNVGFYGVFKGSGAAWEGKTASGLYLDERLSIDWVTDRVETALANLLLTVSNRNQKIPYTDAGFQQIKAEVERVLETGVSAGHFARILNDDTGVLISPLVTVPRRSAVTPSQEAARLVPVTFVATLAGAVHKVTVTGYVNISV